MPKAICVSRRFAGRNWGCADAGRRTAFSGAEVGRRIITTIIAYAKRLRAPVRSLAAIFGSVDGRWALVSTSVTAVIAGTVAWLAVGTSPGAKASTPGAEQSLIPYQLFLDLTKNNASYASLAPGAAGAGSNQQFDATVGFDVYSDVEKRTVELDRGDTLAGMLLENGVSASEAAVAVSAMSSIVNPRSLRAGQEFDLELATPDDATDNGEASTDTTVRLLTLHFSPSIEQDVTLSRNADGSFAADSTQKTLEAHVHRAGTTIDSSLYLAAMQAGIPADVVVEMIRMFSYKVDFQRDIQSGDSFEVYYDYYYTPEGQPARPGNITFAMMRLSGQDIALYRYQPDPEQAAEYFDAKGQSAKGLLMKTPVDGARISSGFGMRRHPILGYSRMHKGIDFAVPKGTPVMAAGNGTITFEGVASGYGNFLKISHANGYATGYGHLSRFAPGIHIGSKVRQGQIVAYSGMTGLATGPHLHYEIFQNGSQVNPLKVKFAEGRKLAGNELRNFLTERLHIDAQMASMKLETKVADVADDLRQAMAK